MADLSFLDNDGGVSRLVSDTPPNHYIVTVKSFSQLTKNNVEKYTSSDFHAGGYKWYFVDPKLFLYGQRVGPVYKIAMFFIHRNLVLHPNGNKSKGITDHISLYLVIAEGNSLPPGWEIRAIFRLFLLDQNKDIYLTLQDTAEEGRRFHGTKLESGFDKFIPQIAFNNSANGYLVNDTCVFGAEVYVCQEKHIGKGESLAMIKDAISYKHTWRIENFSSLTEECVDSKTFNSADHKWKLQLYPNGKGSGAGSYISMYLTLAEPQNLPPASNIYAEFTLRILDQLNRNHQIGTSNYWFSASNATHGWGRFISHDYFSWASAGFLVKNICIVEAEVTVHGVANAL